MFNKYFLLGLVVSVCVTTANTYGSCACYCCEGTHCDPIFEGTIDIATCSGSTCLDACESKFPLSCNSSTTGGIKPECEEVQINSTTTPIVSSTTTLSTTPSTPWPIHTNATRRTTSASTSDITSATSNASTIITTESSSPSSSNITTITSSRTTGNITVSITTSTLTSPITTTPGNITVTITTSNSTATTTTKPLKPTTPSHGGLSILGENRSLFVSIVTSILMIAKVMH
ncbi:unnamed protein product [Rotaria magnacalcarata]|uniref:Antifreeze protein n=1 Tax=Rotaria magnacalcarata TaxID=392030 RepID=A0A815NFC1_9BILA|nr:unnamed protein product [Rotaria magnacalcarata]